MCTPETDGEPGTGSSWHVVAGYTVHLVSGTSEMLLRAKGDCNGTGHRLSPAPMGTLGTVPHPSSTSASLRFADPPVRPYFPSMTGTRCSRFAPGPRRAAAWNPACRGGPTARFPGPENPQPAHARATSGLRFYNPGLGRWISRDPIGEEGGVALFAFVGNSPSSAFDPDGRSAFPHMVVPIPSALLPVDPLLSGGFGGDTVCDFDTGVPRTTVAKDYCSGRCVFRHEAVHLGQMWPCCARAARCKVRARGGPPGPGRVTEGTCVEKYHQWLFKVRDFIECEAFRDSVNCFKAAIRREDDCDCKKELRGGLKNARRKISEHCPGAHYQCPFDESGRFDPRWDLGPLD